MRDKKRTKILFLLVLLVGISVGFASIATTLKINGATNIGKNTWSVYWDAVGNVSKSSTVTETVGARVKPGDVTSLEFNVTLNEPGDYYEFQADAVNGGTLDAMVNVVSVLINDDENATLPPYISYSIKYLDGTDLQQYHLLEQADTSTNPITPTRERIKIRVEFLRSVTEAQLESIDNSNDSYDITVELPYDQADDSAIDRNASPMNLGDYFTLVPDVDDYTVPTGLTGYEDSTGWYSQDTIHPSELTLWRVIDIHQDGTVDAVSEYTSSTRVLVYGLRGYQNFVGGLQTIASQYAKAGYTVGTRSMGYDGQTLTIQDTSSLSSTSGDFHNYSNTMEYDSVGPVTGTGSEVDGGLGGDTLYLKDIQLVGNVYKSDTATYGDLGLKASVVGTSDYDAIYWVTSRGYIQHNDFEGFYGINCNGTRVGRTANLVQRNSGGVFYSSDWYYIRPIITLKKGLTVDSGTGTLNDPYIFE